MRSMPLRSGQHYDLLNRDPRVPKTGRGNHGRCRARRRIFAGDPRSVRQAPMPRPNPSNGIMRNEGLAHTPWREIACALT
jgi:hypothetical protein